MLGWTLLAVAPALLLPIPLGCRRCAPACRVGRGAVLLSGAEWDDLEGVEFDDDDEYEDDDDGPGESALAGGESMASLRAQASSNMTMAEVRDTLRRLGVRTRGTKDEMLRQLRVLEMKEKAGVPLVDTEIGRDDELRWYMLQTANGFERAVERTLTTAADVQGLQDDIAQVFVPIREGETSVREASVMPSYIFVRMKMNGDLHAIVSGMQYVVAFVGADFGGRSRSGQMAGTRGFVRPKPLTQQQFEAMVAHTRLPEAPEEGAAAEPVFEVGEVVKVTKGPFKGLAGAVVELDGDEKVVVSLTVMGQATPVEVPLRHVEPS